MRRIPKDENREFLIYFSLGPEQKTIGSTRQFKLLPENSTTKDSVLSIK
ncbi:MAG: hypothetical protein WCF23_05025 [Candidatus Nitrosopolaris sp.]